MDLDIDLNKAFRQGIDLDQTWIDSARKSTEAGDQANITLRDGLVGIRAADAAGNRAEETDAATKSADCLEVSVGVDGEEMEATYS